MTERSPEEVRQLVSDGRWKRKHLVSMREQFGEQALFDALFSAFTQKPPVAFHQQERPGDFLLDLKPRFEADLSALIRRSLRGWNRSIEQLPYYFRDTCGADRVRDVLQEIESDSGLDETELDALKTYRFWLHIEPQAEQGGDINPGQAVRS